MSVHLFVRSAYTLLQSTIRLEPLVKKAADDGFKALALTDHNVMHGVPEFLHLCAQYHIKPIVGMETDVSYHDETVPFLLLAEDAEGYEGLMQMSTILQTRHAPLSAEELKQYSPHCLLIAYGEGGYMDSELIHDDREGLRNKLQMMKEELPAFDVALSYQEASLWKERNAVLKRIAGSLGLRTAAINKIYYLNPDDSLTLKLLDAIRTNRTFHDASLLNVQGRCFLSQQEMASLYDEDDLKRTDELAALCTGNYTVKKAQLPLYPIRQKGVSSREYLEALCNAGLKKRLHDVYKEEYMERLKYELGVIEQMHFEDYFLIVYDFILYARHHGIYVGPGRGSAAGSLVAYSLGITEIDPLRYHLLFERFLNPERVSMPDIDTDFPDNRRDEVKQYVCDKYGRQNAAGIVTFSTIGARQSIMDTARVLNMNKRDEETLLRLLPKDRPGHKTTLRSAYQENPRLRTLIASEKKFADAYKMAARIEGLPRNCSVHAAGVILSRNKLTDTIPMMDLEGNSLALSQYTAGYLEERGLIKIDFLSLRNLTIIAEITQKVKETSPSFDILHIPLDDKRTYEIFAQGNTIGVFQFEGEGMKSLLRRMKPKNIEEIAAALALYRPGPMENIDTYLKNRADPAHIVYPHPSLKPILAETYGVIVYQEQIMRIAQSAAGFSLGKADILRKSISKKKVQEMNAMRSDFLSGCIRNGWNQKDAENLFSLIEKFAGYGFNKSHAVAYSFVAYQLAYLKAEYPLNFYCALLNSVVGDQNKTSRYIAECRRRQIVIKGPDINLSLTRCFEEGSSIRLPLAVINGIGTAACSAIVEERKKNGPYTDFYDFTARMNVIRMDRQKIENMIDAGALDCFNMGRRSLLYGLDEAMQYAELVEVKDGSTMRLNLDLVSKPVMVRLKDEPQEKSEREKAALGFNLGKPPIVLIKEKYGIQVPVLSEIEGMRGRTAGCAVIRSVKKIRTHKGDPMAFVHLSDESGEGDMAVMPRQYAKYRQILVSGTVIYFEGKKDERSFIPDTIKEIKTRG